MDLAKNETIQQQSVRNGGKMAVFGLFFVLQIIKSSGFFR